MAISRVVKRSHLNQWLESNAAKTYTVKETVDEILKVVEQENVELCYETNTSDYIFIRIEQIVKDLLRATPWSTSGGALTMQSPLKQIALTRHGTLKTMPYIRERHVEYNDPTVTIHNENNKTTLTINTSCEV